MFCKRTEAAEVPCADPYTGVDLDHRRDPQTGVIAPWAQQIIAWLKSYTEVSPSGTGIKIFVHATLPGRGVHKHCLEMYDRGRFFTVTGWHVPGAPCTLEPRQSRIEALYAIHALLTRGLERYGKRFSLLFAGQWERLPQDQRTMPYRSQSEADLAFCALMARIGATAEQIDTLLRLSGLYRTKWDERHGAQTYGTMTIAKAMARSNDASQSTHHAQGRPQPHGGNAQRAHDAPDVEPVLWEPPLPFSNFTQPAFPLDALPEPLQRYVAALAEATQTPGDLAGMLVLGIRPGYTEPVNLFVAVVMPPGSRKSTVFAAVMEPLHTFEAAEVRRLEPLIAEAESHYRITEKLCSRPRHALPRPTARASASSSPQSPRPWPGTSQPYRCLSDHACSRTIRRRNVSPPYSACTEDVWRS